MPVYRQVELLIIENMELLQKLLGVTPKNQAPIKEVKIEGEVETPLNTKRLHSLMNIDTAFKQTRLIAILTLISSFLFCAMVMVVAMNMVTKGKGKIYITNGYGNTLTAYQIAANENRKAEVKAQVRNFHALLYDITPNPDEIKKKVDQVLLMGDASVKAFMDKRGDSYYKKLISSSVEIKYELDSIRVNIDVYPYKAVQYGKEIVQTQVGFLVKNLITSLELSDVARTDDNPHGLLVGGFEIHKNNRIQFVEMNK